jgi:SAM-dependent methyltransferase
MKILDIGCGNNKYIGPNKKDKVIGIDSVKLDQVDVVHNLEKFPWPFKDNEFDRVVTNHCLEHLTDLVKTMEEIHRITKRNSLIEINVPYFAFYGAFQDPTHKRFFTWKTFEYFSKNSHLSYYTKNKYVIIRRKLTFIVTRPVISKIFDPIINFSPRFYERMLSGILPAENLNIVLKVEK